MKELLEGLKVYLENTSREKLLQDWEATNVYANVGPTVEEFFEGCGIYSQPEYLNNIKNPNSFGFFYYS